MVPPRNLSDRYRIGLQTFARASGNEKHTPTPAIRATEIERQNSTLTRPSRRRQQTVGSAQKRTFAPDLTRPK